MNRVIKPASLKEAADFLAEQPAHIIAGGTDYMVRNRRGAGLPVKTEKPALYIGDLSELKEIFYDDGRIEIGASVTYSELLDKENIPLILKKAVGEIASPAIRNMGTLGGNICNASPAGDSLPPLYVLNAEVKLLSTKGTRVVPIEEFMIGPGATGLRDDELLVSVILDNPFYDAGIFRKIGTRKSNALAKASFCGLSVRKNGVLTDIRIAFGAVAPTVVRLREAEKNLIGKSREEVAAESDVYVKTYEKHIRPIDDQRSTAEYRKGAVLNLLRRFLAKDAWE